MDVQKAFRWALLAVALSPSLAWSQLSPVGPETDPILDYLRSKVASRPDHADSWRLIGHRHLQLGQFEAARNALQRSLTLQPDSVATLFELGNLAIASNRPEQADEYFLQVLALGAETTYADQFRTAHPQAYQRLQEAAARERAAIEAQDIPPEPIASLASYEIKTFDGADQLEDVIRRVEDPPRTSLQRLRIYLETGFLYNSNVSLTPTSRELRDPDVDAAGAQLLFTPDVEWAATRIGSWQTGLLGRGYFTINQSDLSAFDLSSFQPGAFLQREMLLERTTLIHRIEYSYTLDMLDSQRFGDRHSLNLAATWLQLDGDFLYGYWTSSFSQFDDDGATPATDSLDGISHTAGLSQFFHVTNHWCESWNVGADLEQADTQGADYRYRAFTLHTGATLPLWADAVFQPEAGAGYRDYPDFSGSPSRNEFTCRLAGRIRWYCTEQTGISFVTRYDRFQSDNAQFDAERLEGGILLTYQR